MSAIAAAGLPLAAALLGILAVAASGFDHAAALPPRVEPYFYGFFLTRYPLFAAAILYGLARLVVAAAAPGPSGILRRTVGLGLGAALMLGVSLYPTFGGLVLRAAFGTGSIAFLNRQPMVVAYALGSAAGAVVFGSAMGLAILAIGNGPSRGWRSRAATLLARFFALWAAFAILGLAGDAGFGPWPLRPLAGGDAALAIGLVLAAFLPHAVLVGWRARSREAGLTAIRA